MKRIETLENALMARYELARFIHDTERGWLGTPDGLLPFPPAELELSIEWGKLMLSWWNDDQSHRLRLTGYTIEAQRIIVEGVRGLGTVREQVVIDRRIEGRPAALEIPPVPLPARRAWYGARLVELVHRHLQPMRVRHWSTGTDRHHQVPGNYARLVIEAGNETMLGIGVSGAETAATIEAITAAGLIWCQNYNRERTPARQARRLCFFLPCGQSLTVIERLSLLRIDEGRTGIGCGEVDELRGELEPVRPVSQLELLTAPPRDLHWPILTGQLERLASQWHERIIALAPPPPGQPGSPGSIETRYRVGRRVISYSIHGLEFARIPIDDPASAEFGVSGDPAQRRRRSRPLTERRFPELRRLVAQLLAVRCAATTDRQHPFFRWRTEAWLESLLRRDIRALDHRLDPRYVYSQIPAWHADQRSIIDLLTIRRDESGAGRLTVIEIKAGEDPQLPLQGLDYWMRVEQARIRGEFGRQGLFAGTAISDQPPLLYLVAPRLRFHRSFVDIARCLHPLIEAYRVGLNTDWRAGIRVHALELLPSR